MAWAVVPPDPVVLAGMLPLENIRGVDGVTTGPFRDLKRKSCVHANVQNGRFIVTQISFQVEHFFLKMFAELLRTVYSSPFDHVYHGVFNKERAFRKIQSFRNLISSKFPFEMSVRNYVHFFFLLDKTSILPKLHRFFPSTISCLSRLTLTACGMCLQQQQRCVCSNRFWPCTRRPLWTPSHITPSFVITFLST